MVWRCNIFTSGRGVGELDFIIIIYDSYTVSHFVTSLQLLLANTVGRAVIKLL